MRKIFSILPKALPWALFTASLLPLLGLAWLGNYTRLLADDYSTSEALARLGFWQVQSFWYQTWSGRYSFTFLVSLVELSGVDIVSWLPLTGLLLWGSALFYTFRNIFKTLGLSLGSAWLGILTCLVIFGTLKGFHEFAQVIFWQTGILTYQISIIFITALIGLFLERFFLSQPRPLTGWELAAWTLVFLVGGGFSETWVIIQITLTGLALLTIALFPIPNKKSIYPVILFGLLASWVALIIIAKSPGNMNRDTIMAELSFSLLRSALTSAFLDLPRFLFEWLIANTALAMTLLLGGLSAGAMHPTPVKNSCLLWLGFGLLFGAYILFWAGFVPQYAVMGIRPAERAIFMPMFMFIWAFILLAVFAGSQIGAMFTARAAYFVRFLLTSALALTLLWVPARAAISYVNLVPHLRMYAQLWDTRDQYLRQSAARGQRDVVVDSLRRNPDLHEIQSGFWIEADLQDDPDHWINQMAASYYGLKSIRLRR